MKKLKLMLIFLVLTMTFLLTSCPEPSLVGDILEETQTIEESVSQSETDIIITGNGSPESSGEGSITIKMPLLNSQLIETLKAEQQEQSRALFMVKSISFSVKNSEDIEVASYSADFDFLGFMGEEFAEISMVNIPFGSGYYVEIEIINPDVSASDPVLAGVSETFSIGLEAALVDVTVLPVNPVILHDNYSADVTVAGSVYNPSEMSFNMGGEAWYELTATEDIASVTITPSGASGPYCIVYDESGSNISHILSPGIQAEPIVYGQNAEASFSLTAGQKYYLGLVTFAENKNNQIMTFSFDYLEPLADDSYEPNDSYGDAAEVSVGQVINANISSSEDIDYYKVDVTPGHYYFIDAYDYDSMYFNFYVWNMYGSSYANDLDSDGDVEKLFMADSSGINYIYAGSEQMLEYSLSVTEVFEPSASFTMSDETADITDTVSFDASASSSTTGSIVDYDWDFGDGNTASGQSPTHTFSSVGQYFVILTVTDEYDLSSSTMQKITVNSIDNNAPVANAGADQEIDVDVSGGIVSLDGSGSSDSDGTISSYHWEFFELPVNSSLSDSYISNADSVSASFDFLNESEGYLNEDGNYFYSLLLVVTDDEGAESYDIVNITISGSGDVNVNIE